MMRTTKMVKKIAPIFFDEDDIETDKTFYMPSDVKSVEMPTNLSKWFKENIVHQICNQIDQAQGNGTGWTLGQINSLNVCF